MRIRDNGKGIYADKINSLTSMGLTGIKERVESVSGTVRIKGEKNKGTLIDVNIPLTKKSDK
jgi:signal transduction histidine kinase